MVVDQEVAEFLEHVGVKGMKWGVRRARRYQTVTRAGRANSGVASRARLLIPSYLPGVPKLGPIDFVKGRGVRGGAARKARRINSREARIRSGRGHLSDKIMHYGSTHLSDLVPVRTKNAQKRTFTSNDKMMATAVGTVFVLGLVSRYAQNKALSNI